MKAITIYAWVLSVIYFIIFFFSIFKRSTGSAEDHRTIALVSGFVAVISAWVWSWLDYIHSTNKKFNEDNSKEIRSGTVSSKPVTLPLVLTSVFAIISGIACVVFVTELFSYIFT
jgi:hypothetical protein